MSLILKALSATLAYTFTSLYLTSACNSCCILLIAMISKVLYLTYGMDAHKSTFIIGIRVVVACRNPRNTEITNWITNLFVPVIVIPDLSKHLHFWNRAPLILFWTQNEELCDVNLLKTGWICCIKWSWEENFASVQVILKLVMSGGQNDWHVRCVLSLGEGETARGRVGALLAGHTRLQFS